MSIITNIDKIAFSSEFNYDKILDVPYSGNFACSPATVSPGSTGTVTTYTASHAAGTGALPVMIWSTDNLSWYEAGSFDYSPGSFLDLRFVATVGVSNTDFRIVAKNYTAGILTCYWKLVLIDG